MAQLKITPAQAAAFVAARKLSYNGRKTEKKRLMREIRSQYPAISRSSKIKLFVENPQNPLYCVIRDKRTGAALDDGQDPLTPAQIKAAAKVAAKAAADAAKANAAKLKTDALAAIAASDAASAAIVEADAALAALEADDAPATVADDAPAPLVQVENKAPAAKFADKPAPLTKGGKFMAAKKAAPIKVAKPAKKVAAKVAKPAKPAPAASKKVAAPVVAKKPAKPVTTLAKGAKLLVDAPAPKESAVVYPRAVRVAINGVRVRLGVANSAAQEKKMVADAKAAA